MRPQRPAAPRCARRLRAAQQQRQSSVVVCAVCISRARTVLVRLRHSGARAGGRRNGQISPSLLPLRREHLKLAKTCSGQNVRRKTLETRTVSFRAAFRREQHRPVVHNATGRVLRGYVQIFIAGAFAHLIAGVFLFIITMSRRSSKRLCVVLCALCSVAVFCLLSSCCCWPGLAVPCRLLACAAAAAALHRGVRVERRLRGAPLCTTPATSEPHSGGNVRCCCCCCCRRRRRSGRQEGGGVAWR